MKAVLYVIATLLIAAALAAGVVSQFSIAQAPAGIDLGTSAILLAGGCVVLGLAALMGAISTLSSSLPAANVSPERIRSVMPGERELPDYMGTLTPASAVAGAAQQLRPAASSPGSNLSLGAPADHLGHSHGHGHPRERERPKVAAFDPAPDPPRADPAPMPPPEHAQVPDPQAMAHQEAYQAAPTEMDDLYVVEERMIRGKAARVLSDGTVEAETDEGWMRFENVEHLEEYVDAMSAGQSAQA